MSQKFAYVLVFYHYTKNGIIADSIGIHSTLWKAKMDLVTFATEGSSPIDEYKNLIKELRKKRVKCENMNIQKLTHLLYNHHSILLREFIPHNIYRVPLGTLFDFERLPYEKTFYEPKERITWDPCVIRTVNDILKGKICPF